MMHDSALKVVAIVTEHDVIAARQEGRAIAQRLQFSPVDQSRITTAISELARNIICYGVRGTVTFKECADENGKPGIEISFDDEGPGIEDIEQAMKQGFTSGGGLGAGLPGSKRLASEFEIKNAPTGGLHVRIVKWRS